MRKNLYRILFFSLVLTSNIAISQHLITGWKAGVNLSRRNFITGNSELDKSISEDNKSQLGLDLGVFKIIPLKQNWSVNIDLMYQLRRHRINDRKYYYSYININPNIQYEISKSVMLFSGINIGVLINALTTFEYYENDFAPFPEGVPEIKTINVNKLYKPLDLQWSSGLGFEINDKWHLELRNAISLLDVNSRYGLPSDAKPIIFKFWSLSLSTKYYLK